MSDMQNNEKKKELQNAISELTNSIKAIPRKSVGTFKSLIVFLILLGILAILQKNGTFEGYPAIEQMVSTILSFFNWFYGIIVRILNWIVSIPPVRWIANI